MHNSNENTHIGSLEVTYTRKNSEIVQRYSAKHGISGQSMMREPRHNVFSPFYTDMDEINAHSIQTVWLCGLFNIECSYLTKYTTDRESIFEDLKNVNKGWIRDNCKKYLLSTLYGKTTPFIVNSKGAIDTDFMNKFKIEIRNIHIAICHQFKGFYNKVKKYRISQNKSYNIHGCCMALINQLLECQFLMMSFYKIRELEGDKVFKSVLCHDGLMCSKEIFSEVLLEKINKLFKEIDVPITIKDKPFDEAFDLKKAGYDANHDYTKDIKPPTIVEKLLSRIEDKYRRDFGTGVIYKRKLEYYFERKYDNLHDFINKIFSNYENEHMGSKTTNELIEFIKHRESDRFPWIRINYNYIGFTNGVYDVRSNQLLTDYKIPKGIQVRTFINVDCNIGAPTPRLDKKYNVQFNAKEREFAMFVFGRCVMGKITDRFDFIPFLQGASNAGKSIDLNLIRHSFSPRQIGVFGGTQEQVFGLSNWTNKQLVTCDDMPRDIHKKLQDSDFKSIASRGSVTCPVKGKDPIIVDSWDIPMIINSNDLPNYKDHSGEIVRRVGIIKYDITLPEDEKDNMFERDILKFEYGQWLDEACHVYNKYSKEYERNSINDFMPQKFRDANEELREYVNRSFEFAKSKLVYCDNNRIYKSEMTRAFREHVMKRFELTNTMEKLNPNDIKRADTRFDFIREQICKHCRKHHIRGCCNQYSRTDRTLSEYFINVRIKTNI